MGDSDAPQSAEGCPDSGTCHHRCLTGCWRVAYAEPLSIVGYPQDRWPGDVRRQYANVVQDGSSTRTEAPAVMHWGSVQGRILRYLHEYVAANGYPPSMREVAAHVKLTSTSTVAHHLSVLEARGHIRRVPNSPRAITLLTPLPEDDR